MMDVLLEQVKRAIFNSQQTPHAADNDPDGLIEQIQNIFGQYGGQQQAGMPQSQGGFGDVRSASEDPYGDPADLENPGYRNVGQQGFQLPADADVRPASEDPYGDPADASMTYQNPPGQFTNASQPYSNAYGNPVNLPPGADVRPASEDPYGDPADLEDNRR